VNGRVDVPPQNMVSISVPLGGYLKSTKLLEGMHLNKGEVIAIVEDQQYIQLQQDYLTARAKIGYLENEYHRQKALNQSQASSDKVYQLAESEYRTQQVLITALAEKLSLAGINIQDINESHIQRNINIYSPIAGFVSKINVNIGKYVSPTEVLFELVNPSDIHLALKIYEKDIDQLYVGQKLLAYTNNQPENKHACTIILLGKTLSNDGYTDIHSHFESYDKSLLPGTYMNAEIELKSRKVNVLPSEAIVRYEGKQYIYRAGGDNQYEMVEVQTGESENGFTEIILPQMQQALTSDFAVKGAYTLLMTMKNKAE
jgi:membrane fusion protein, heavy metal efflux system